MSSDDSSNQGENRGRFGISGETTRRGALAAVVAAGVGGLSLSGARELLDAFAPLSGRAWDAADRTIDESVDNPYGTASIHRDDEGVPHIDADDELAGYFAVGYVQAFDRLAQMDLIRRVMRGEVAEVAGEELADDDEFHRRMDFVAAAEATVEAMEGTRIETIGEAYADGVNAAIENEQLPFEFEVLGYEPDEWTLVDSLLMEKQISWGLTGLFTQLRFAEVHGALTEELDEEAAESVIEALYPTRIDHETPILREQVSGESGSPPLGRLGDPHGEVGSDLTAWLSEHESGPHIGSNSWVVGPEHGATDAPVVANDTHLPLMAPSVWYEQHLSLEEYDVRGLTFPGVPFVVIGANQDGAWGFTNSGADVLDCYSYETDDEAGEYRYKDDWVPFETDEVVIEIDGAENRTITRRYTEHGPLLEEHGQRVAVSWNGLAATRTVEAMYEINRSEGLEDIDEAARLFDSPDQCFTYASSDGDTLFRVTGQLPIRDVDMAEKHPATTIYDGSAGEAEWEGFEPYTVVDWEEAGFIPYEEMPHVVNPDYVATANQRIVDDHEHYIGVAYAAPYRGGRIYDLLDEQLDAGGTMTLEDHMDLQMDNRDGRGPDAIPDIQAAVEAVDTSGDVQEAAATLADWNYEMERDSEGALLFARWFDHFRDEVLHPTYENADLEVDMLLRRDWVFLRVPDDNPLFDAQSRDEAIVAALEAALEEIDEAGWETYGDWNHTGHISHPFGDELPFLNYPKFPTDGSRMTVNNYNIADVFGEPSGSAFRMVAEPGGDAWLIVPGGNSGDYFSEHYNDQLERFTNGEFRRMNLEITGDEIVSMPEGSQ